jgi:hypothetical protein
MSGGSNDGALGSGLGGGTVGVLDGLDGWASVVGLLGAVRVSDGLGDGVGVHGASDAAADALGAFATLNDYDASSTSDAFRFTAPGRHDAWYSLRFTYPEAVGKAIFYNGS